MALPIPLDVPVTSTAPAVESVRCPFRYPRSVLDPLRFTLSLRGIRPAAEILPLGCVAEMAIQH